VHTTASTGMNRPQPGHALSRPSTAYGWPSSSSEKDTVGRFATKGGGSGDCGATGVGAGRLSLKAYGACSYHLPAGGRSSSSGGGAGFALGVISRFMGTTGATFGTCLARAGTGQLAPHHRHSISGRESFSPTCNA